MTHLRCCTRDNTPRRCAPPLSSRNDAVGIKWRMVTSALQGLRFRSELFDSCSRSAVHGGTVSSPSTYSSHPAERTPFSCRAAALRPAQGLIFKRTLGRELVERLVGRPQISFGRRPGGERRPYIQLHHSGSRGVPEGRVVFVRLRSPGHPQMVVLTSNAAVSFRPTNPRLNRK
jgi:hypothetical protein